MASVQTEDLRDAIAAVLREQVVAERREWRRRRRAQRVNPTHITGNPAMWDARKPETRPYAP
ncbi:MAG: hypothetical protein M3141_05725 [Actinomycetota bacterium]|nr:hypothetical protein [Actinomycetota bacterium]